SVTISVRLSASPSNRLFNGNLVTLINLNLPLSQHLAWYSDSTGVLPRGSAVGLRFPPYVPRIGASRTSFCRQFRHIGGNRTDVRGPPRSNERGAAPWARIRVRAPRFRSVR